MIEHNPPAFPEVPADSNAYEGRPGMSLRDWFAGQALSGSTCGLFSAEFASPETAAVMAREAYLIADAMLAESKKGGQP